MRKLIRSLASFGAGLVAAIALAGAAWAAPPLAGARYSHVAVDVSALEAKGLGVTARFVGKALYEQMNRAFAGSLGARGAPAILVRITGLSLASYAGPGDGSGGGGRWGGGGSGSNDYLEGHTLVVTRDGTVLSDYPLLTNLPASSAGPWYDPAIDRKRLVALTGAYAGWSQRYLANR